MWGQKLVDMETGALRAPTVRFRHASRMAETIGGVCFAYTSRRQMPPPGTGGESSCQARHFRIIDTADGLTDRSITLASYCSHSMRCTSAHVSGFVAIRAPIV